MTVNSSPVARSSRRDSWEASLQDNVNNNSNNGAALGTQRARSPVSQKARRSVTPPRSGGESDNEDGDFDEYDFNDNDSNCSGSEEPSQPGKGTWTRDEHKRFLEAIKIYPNGPWKIVADYVRTRTVRQTMTHAQKYRQKAARRVRGLRTKQAIMRMHCGHEVSDESLAQEQIRTALGQSRHAYLPPGLFATLSNSPYGSPAMPGSPVNHGSPYMPGSPILSPAMPGSPMNHHHQQHQQHQQHHHQGMMPGNSPAMFSHHDPMQMSFPASAGLLASRLENPLSITIRSATPMHDDAMPTFAPSTPPPSFYGHSPATSPVSALTARMAQHALARRMDGFDLDVIEDPSQGPSLAECANELYEVLFDESSSLKDEPSDAMHFNTSLPISQFDIDI